MAAASSARILPPNSPYVVAPLALGTGVVLGQVIARQAENQAMAFVLLGVTTYLLVAVLWTSGPAKGPLAYANANAALAVQLIGLCGLAMTRTAGRVRAIAALSLTVALAAVGANSSKAGLAVAVPMAFVVALVVWRPVRRRLTVFVALVGAGATIVAAAVAVATLAQRPVWPSRTLQALDPARQTLWRDALTLWQAHPVIGAGPGTYERVSTLGGDPDTAAAHSSVLQVGAETGWVGVTLLALIVGGGLLWACRATPSAAVIGAATWTALVVHSLADHLLDFPAVVLAAGVVLGWARATSSEQLDVAEGEKPRFR